jgi:hypothetical protein
LRLTELLDATYIHSDTVIHILTIDDVDYIFNENGRAANDQIVAGWRARRAIEPEPQRVTARSW